MQLGSENEWVNGSDEIGGCELCVCLSMKNKGWNIKDGICM